jgi:hypothetical protein
MAKTWVLDTETKGTGANMVPLERVTKRTDPKPLVVPPKPRRSQPPEPAPSAPRRFRVVDLMTRRELADDVDAREAIDTLKSVRSVVDVNVYVWQPDRERWRPLTFSERRAMWDMATDGRPGSASRGRP